ncbi:MAG TPA: shikimate dehydrogenase [Chitinophagaceae bacterium]|nr:shikimate dehydrogenase [Chitinophagaceae bacterium]
MRKFGLIGYPLSHSFSKKYFSDIFSKEGIDAEYNNYPIENISMVRSLLEDPLLEGINVTIPYKEAVISYLDELSEAVKEIGACNCIRIRDGRTKGFNTDVLGFDRSLSKKLRPVNDKALVLGTGGAAKAVCYVLRQRNIPFWQVSRKPKEGIISYADVTHAMIEEHRLLINTTPLGMYPNTNECPALPYEAITPDHYLYDLVYNPEKTLFLQKGEERGAVIENGHDMLIIQANESRKIWNI